MANQCEFDMGILTVRPISRRQGHDGNTVSGAATPRRHKPYRERTCISTVRDMREGRGGDSALKAVMGREQTTVTLSPLPPVSWRWRVSKVMETNSGERKASPTDEA